MALFDDGTVIIIGAGASVPFGLPTGLSVITQIQERLHGLVLDLNKCHNDGGNINDFQYVRALLSFSKAGFIGNVNFGQWAKEIEELSSWLFSQTSDTIDDLIRLFPDKKNTLKIALAFELLNATHTVDGLKNFTVMPFENRVFPPILINSHNGKLKHDEKEKRNWIHQLINIARDEIINSKQINGQKIKIVSFNYDGILEYVLEQCWVECKGVKPNYKDYFDIIHPHGLIPLKPKIGCGELVDYLNSTAEEIVVVKENTVDGSVNEARQKARKWCNLADNIFSIGFAFAKSNCELLGLSDNHCHNSSVKRKINYINYDGSYGLRARVSRFDNAIYKTQTMPAAGGGSVTYEIPPLIIERSPKFGEKLEIHEAIMAGFLGEMPS